MADKRQNMTAEQKNLLVQFMAKNPKLRHGKFTADFTYKTAQQLWEECASICNSIPGANKDWKGWRKTWQCMKSITKNKKAAMNRERGTTGGGPCKNIMLKSAEEEIERLISNTEAFGDETVEESAAEFVFEEKIQRHTIDDMEENTYSLDIVDDLEQADPSLSITSNTSVPRASSSTGPLVGNDAETPTSCSTEPAESSARKDKPEKAVARERRRKLSVPAQRLRKSISEAAKLVDVSQNEYELKKKYYERKLEIYERMAVSMEQMAFAIKQFAVAPKEEFYPAEYLDEEF